MIKNNDLMDLDLRLKILTFNESLYLINKINNKFE
jgi:hypothetical protein